MSLHSKTSFYLLSKTLKQKDNYRKIRAVTRGQWTVTLVTSAFRSVKKLLDFLSLVQRRPWFHLPLTLSGLHRNILLVYSFQRQNPSLLWLTVQLWNFSSNNTCWIWIPLNHGNVVRTVWGPFLTITIRASHTVQIQADGGRAWEPLQCLLCPLLLCAQSFISASCCYSVCHQTLQWLPSRGNCDFFCYYI